ncbi:MAG: hypothetical protein JXQ76_11380 [Campylobacterales bacterium]|nr:hypothetical protein [Campylobacterales bacterium]
MRLITLSVFASLLLYANNFYYEYGQKVELTKLSNTRSTNNLVAYYQKSNGNMVGIKKGEILLKCYDGVDCSKVLAKYNFASISNLSSTIFLVKLSSTQDIFNYSQLLHNDSDIEFAHPNFVKKKKRR